MHTMKLRETDGRLSRDRKTGHLDANDEVLKAVGNVVVRPFDRMRYDTSKVETRYDHRLPVQEQGVHEHEAVKKYRASRLSHAYQKVRNTTALMDKNLLQAGKEGTQ
jgi:hypothetical protein